MREMARRLGRSVSTVSDEIARGGRIKGEYIAIKAQRLRDERKARSYQWYPLKNEWLYGYVLGKLRRGWSPKQIEGRLKKEYPDNPHRHISYETIYQFIYADENKDKRLWEYLPRKQTKRRKQTGRTVHKSRISDRVSIHERPEDANDKRPSSDTGRKTPSKAGGTGTVSTPKSRESAANCMPGRSNGSPPEKPPMPCWSSSAVCPTVLGSPLPWTTAGSTASTKR